QCYDIAMERAHVPDVVDEQVRQLASRSGKKDSSASYPWYLTRTQTRQKRLWGFRLQLESRVHGIDAGAPDDHNREDSKRHGQRHPAAVCDLQEIGAKKAQVDNEE